jgi:hypothetical protein
MVQQPPGPPNYPPPPGAPPPAVQQATAPAYPPPPGAGAAAPPTAQAYASGGPAPGYGPDPYAAQRAVEEWATARGYALNASPDFAWYQGWQPFAYLFRFARVGREIRAQFNEVTAFVVEAFEADPFKQATGEDRNVCCFLTSPKLVARAAFRAKLGGGVVNELRSGLGSLFSGGGSPGGVLGDPTFETRFDVQTPSRDEGNRALPMPLRQHLLQSGWRGIVETRPGGLVCVTYGQSQFEPQTLDTAITVVGQIYHLAVG